MDGRRFKAWKFRTVVQNADAVLRDHLDRDPALRDEWERSFKLKNDPRDGGRAVSAAD
jgi:lipopolysaccharide/colanic/teichoic acid biosynthesis glycosyltransferase